MQILRNEVRTGLMVLVTLGLDYHVAGTQPHSIGDCLFMPTIEQTQRYKQQGKTQAEGQGGQQRTARIAPQVAPTEFREKKETCHFYTLRIASVGRKREARQLG